MSRIGKHPVQLPAGVTCQINEQEIRIKGKNGELSFPCSQDVDVTADATAITVAPRSKSQVSRRMWGTTRNILSNMVKGVSEGFTVNLEIEGVGYRAAVEGSNLKLQLGFSHDIMYPVPAGISIKCEKPTMIAVSGADRQKVGQVAAEIRGFKEPEPYKGKGIRYNKEVVFRKETKKK